MSLQASRLACFSPQNIRNWIIAVACLLSQPAGATVTLLNGSFEQTTGGQIICCGLQLAASWVDTANPSYNAVSAPSGMEATVPTNGSRYLRLVSDNGIWGTIYQNLGAMVVGQVYTITGDVVGSSNSVNQTWGATVELASNGATSYGLNGFASLPSVYATETLGAAPIGGAHIGAINITYTATSADDGNPLYISFIANASRSGTDIRGGIDNLQLSISGATSVPEPTSLAIFGGAILLLGRQRLAARNTRADQ